jgi:hypothetical protein
VRGKVKTPLRQNDLGVKENLPMKRFTCNLFKNRS